MSAVSRPGPQRRGLHVAGDRGQAAMEYFLQQLINGVTLGAIYGLIAIGYIMVYGIIGMINFAHGDVFMIGAFIALITIVLLGIAGMGVGALDDPHPRQ